MEISIDRIYAGKTYTIGLLFIDGEYFCDVLEDTDRGLEDSMSEFEIKEKKIKHNTAIPTGRYRITMNVVSPKYKKIMPRILDVKGFDGILIHSGNTEKDTSGCILVGENKEKGMVLNSRNTFARLFNILKNTKEDIFITVSRQYKK